MLKDRGTNQHIQGPPKNIQNQVGGGCLLKTEKPMLHLRAVSLLSPVPDALEDLHSTGTSDTTVKSQYQDPTFQLATQLFKVPSNRDQCPLPK